VNTPQAVPAVEAAVQQIMELADTFCNASDTVVQMLGANAGMDEGNVYWVEMKRARAALESALRAELASPLVGVWDEEDDLIVSRLRAACLNIRTKSAPLSDLIPLMQLAADALESATHTRHQEVVRAEPDAYLIALPGQPLSITVPVAKIDKLAAMHNAPLYTAPAGTVPLSAQTESETPRRVNILIGNARALHGFANRLNSTNALMAREIRSVASSVEDHAQAIFDDFEKQDQGHLAVADSGGVHAPEIAQLMKFYNADTLEAVVLAQNRQIEGLQARLPRDNTPMFQRVREG
jgi:hypothetical protein